jgi:hypothetical protein
LTKVSFKLLLKAAIEILKRGETLLVTLGGGGL